MTRTLSILATLAFLMLSLLVIVGLGGRLMHDPEAGAAGHAAALSEAMDPRDVCGVASEGDLTGLWLVDELTNRGTYMARTHCMVTEEGTTDWPWVWALLGLNAIVIAGYLKIFVFWRRAYLGERPEDRNRKLMDLAWIFLWCAVCGYAASILMFFWPAYRLVALCLVPLGFFTWRFASNLDAFRVSLSAKRLQRELEESLLERTNELERAVEARTRELRAARVDADRANAAKGEFLANMSHEIRTPMTAILGFADIIDEPDLDPETRTELTERIRVSGRHLLTVINDVLDMARIEHNKMRVEPVSCAAHRVISEGVALFESVADDHAITLDLQFDAPFPECVRTDPTRLRQIVMNLVSNAIKFTHTGGVTVRARVEDEGGRGRLVVEVADTGIGMTGEQLGRLFKPFEQADTSTERRFGGSGLGLVISRTLARMLDGDLTAASTPDRGSTFRLEIDAGEIAQTRMLDDPARAAREVVSTAPRLDAQPTLAGRVLLVDDGEDNRRLIAFHLDRLGAEVHEAINGLDALHAIEAAPEPFGVVLMDLQMPEMDGYETVRRIKRDHPRLPVIAVTADARDETRDRCFASGFDDVITKPIDPVRLLWLTHAWLSGGGSRAA